MAKVVKAAELAAEVNSILADYRGVVQDVLVDAVDMTVKEVVKELRQTSPKASGAYAKSWTQTRAPWKNGAGYGRIAYNKDHYRLTHLLEYGHDIMRNGCKVGRAQAHPHIKQAEAQAIDNFRKRLKEGLNDAR